MKEREKKSVQTKSARKQNPRATARATGTGRISGNAGHPKGTEGTATLAQAEGGARVNENREVLRFNSDHFS